MKFNDTSYEYEDLIKIIPIRDSIVWFLRDIQNEWRIKRSIQKDPEDRLLIWSECIDEIISRLNQTETYREQYIEYLKKEQEKENSTNAKNS